MYGSDTESYHYSDSDTEDDVGCPQPRAVESGAMAPPRDLWSEMLSAEAQQQRGQASSPRGAQPRGGDDDDADSPVSSQSGGGARGAHDGGDDDQGSCLEDLLASLPLSASYDMSAYDTSLGRLGGVSARRDSEDESFCDDSSLAESEGYAPRVGGAFGGGGARSMYGAVEAAAGDDDDDGASASSRLAGRKRVAARGPSGATPSRRRVKVAAVGVALAATLGVVAFVQGPDGDLPMGVMPDGDKLSWTDPATCLETASVHLYKYTLASSSPIEDANWVDEMFGCSFRNVTDTHGCSSLGKTSCVSSSLAFGLHFVHNDETPSGPMTVKDWDRDIYGTNKDALAADEYSQFMDYSLTFYSPNMTDTLEHLEHKGTKFLLRKSNDRHNVTWYSAVVQSKTGKVFEVTSTILTPRDHEIREWSVVGHNGECAAAHLSTTYDADDYDYWYHSSFRLGAKKTSAGLTQMLPIRTSIAVPDLDKVVSWYRHNIPSVQFKTHRKCGREFKWATAAVPAYTDANYTIEVRFVENAGAYAGEAQVSDFVSYIDSVNANYTGVNWGWSAWYDRHLGIMISGCPLDDYMKNFAARGVSFHPHGRENLTTQNTGTPTDHCWTEGTAGFGLEMQGNFSYEFAECYEVFNWCQWDTDPSDQEKACENGVAKTTTSAPGGMAPGAGAPSGGGASSSGGGKKKSGGKSHHNTED